MSPRTIKPALKASSSGSQSLSAGGGAGGCIATRHKGIPHGHRNPDRTSGRARAPDLAAIKTKQQAAWSSGNYAVVGTTLQIVGEALCEALDLRSGQTVLDVAAGNGNATLAAARRWCDVTSTDYVSALLERGRMRAEAEGLTVEFQQADARRCRSPAAASTP